MSFKESGWDAKTCAQEHPFGVGFSKCLYAASRCIVTSGRQRVDFETNAALARTPIEVTQVDATEAISGTRVELHGIELPDLAARIQALCQGFALPVLFNGHALERRLALSRLTTMASPIGPIHLGGARDQLALRRVSSPFHGVVLDRLLNPGDIAEAGSGRKPVLRIAQIDPLRVDIVMPAALIGRVKPGMKARVSPMGLAGQHAAQVKMVDRVIDAASGTFVARLELPNPSHALPGGLRCQAEIDGLDNPALAARRAAP